MRTINYYGQQIAYSVQGEGLPIVFIHGFGANRKVWDNFIPKDHSYKVIAIDLPGAGDSELYEGSIARKAKIVNAVLIAEQIAKCVMVGHSMGGYTTLAFAKLYEEKLLGYCLFHSQANGDSAEKKKVRNKIARFIENHGSARFFNEFVSNLFADSFVSKNAPILEEVANFGAQMSDKAVINQLKAMRDRPDSSEVLTQSKVPVCFIIGGQDTAILAEDSLKQTYLPALSSIHILPEVGHMGMYEAKEETWKIVEEFISFCQGNY